MDEAFFYINESIHPPNFKCDFHTHDFLELSYVVGGEGSYKYFKGNCEKEIPVCSDCILFWDGALRHRAIDKPQDPLHQILLLFNFSFLYDDLLAEKIRDLFGESNPVIINTLKASLHFKSTLRKLIGIHKTDSDIKTIQTASLLQLLLVEIIQTCRQKNFFHDLTTVDTRIKQTVEYIKESYNQPLYLNECASMCGVSARHFSEIFKANCGVSFTQYVNNYRMEMAKKLLRETEKKIIAIAFETGFDNVSLFNRLFKEYCGMTPGKYREE